MFRLLTLMVALTLTHTNHASASAYKCVIEERLELTDAGALERVRSGSYVGKDFVVDRATGRMSGILTNHGSFGQPEVEYWGLPGQAFKVLTEFGGNKSNDYLYVQEFLEQSDKPFIFITSDEIFSGLCRDY